MTSIADTARARHNTMSFEPISDAAIEFLRRRRRVTCRVPQRGFGHDADALADLKEELVLAQRLGARAV